MRRPRRLERHPPAALVIGLIVLFAIFVLAIAGPLLWSHDASALTPALRAGPSAAHPLGTDALGRDVLDRTLVATRLTIVMALFATLIAVCGGLLLGAAVVVAGRMVRTLGERLIDLLIAYPPIVFALTVTAIFQPSEHSVVVAIGLAFMPQFARLANSMAASVRARDYVTVAQLLGLGPWRLLRRHIVPNMAGPLLVLTSVGFASAILALSGLSYIGLGVQDPSYDWGKLLSLGLQDLQINPIEAVGPALGILLTGLAAGLVGDGLNQYLNPRSATRRSDRSHVTETATSAGHSSEPGPVDSPSAVVSVRDLRVALRQAADKPLVHGVSLELRRGEIVGLVGESGSGKTLTAMSIARLLPPGMTWSASALGVSGMDINGDGTKAPARLARELGMVFQDPSSSFNPARHIGPQLTEVLRVHQRMGRRQAEKQATGRLREVSVSAPERRMRQYPHELSGGMRQRAMIAMALTTLPAVLIADEPTTALDVTVQADVLGLLRRLNTAHDMAILLISHDINVVAAICHRVCVMYAGRIVEELTVQDLDQGRVCHPYTQALLASAPKLTPAAARTPLRVLPGRPPPPGLPVAGCSFAPRCSMAQLVCGQLAPELRTIGNHGRAACHITTGPLLAATHVDN